MLAYCKAAYGGQKMTHQHLLQVLRKKAEGGPDPDALFYPDYSLASAGLKESSASTLSPYQQSQRSPYLHDNVGMLQGSVGGQANPPTQHFKDFILTPRLHLLD